MDIAQPLVDTTLIDGTLNGEYEGIHRLPTTHEEAPAWDNPGWTLGDELLTHRTKESNAK